MIQPLQASFRIFFNMECLMFPTDRLNVSYNDRRVPPPADSKKSKTVYLDDGTINE